MYRMILGSNNVRSMAQMELYHSRSDPGLSIPEHEQDMTRMAICKLYRRGYSQSDLQRMFNMSKTDLRRCLTNPPAMTASNSSGGISRGTSASQVGYRSGVVAQQKPRSGNALTSTIRAFTRVIRR
ncbi:hypothetical protein J8273_5015 [Carpediemonas membranifera]|uniref:Uncharacterized protein n=1 Tax=Carpediemonas membranifera TaxID=201153 RepID=A0A8J6B1B3_9EUKA|nr:hypothetical protein J8273_5015 [Carpediemonas membranifera]|eukprot:KAG9393528.1 hypothetical protein J8273_5015 [Carpediemonas membranifera]